MKQQNLLTKMLLLFALVVGSVSSVWAQEVYTHTFTKTELENLLTSDQELTDDNDETLSFKWSFTAKHDNSNVTMNNGDSRGIQVGSGTTTNSCRTLTLSTSGISGNISKIVVVGGLARSGAGTINAKINDYDFGGSNATQGLVASGSEAGTYTFEGNATGTVLITMSQPTTNKAMYLKSIEITYTDASAVEKPTFSPAGGTIYEATNVTISAATGCTIYYTTDGSTPTQASATGTSVVIPASGTTVLKAIAVDGSNKVSGVATAEYTYKNPALLYETKSSFSSGETSGKLEDLIKYTSYQGGAGTAPGIYNNGIRLYQISGSNNYGGYITLSADDGYRITGFSIKTTNTYSTTVDYTVDGSTSIGEGEILGKNSEYSKDGLFNKSVSIYNLGTGSNGRLEIASITVFYIQVTSANIASSGYSTLSNDNALDFANAVADDDEADALVAYIIPSNDGVKLTKTEVTEAPAGTGILLKGTAGVTYTIPVKANATAVGTNLLKAGPVTVPDGNETIYLLKSGQFHLASAGTTSAGKAYLELPAAVGAPALSIDNDDETTGIGMTTVNGQQTTDGVYYDLSGRRVAQPTKGLYIVNGKKIVIK